MVAPAEQVPLRVRIEMGHAHLQWVANEHGIRVLHIKGAALDERISWPGRTGSDVDVIVPAADADRLVRALQSTGWRLANSFRHSSAFEHAATLRHQELGWADVHRCFPGINRDADQAFELLWADRGFRSLGGFDCAVPSLPAQILLLVLHAARSPASGRAPMDVASSWGAADARDPCSRWRNWSATWMPRWASLRAWAIWTSIAIGETTTSGRSCPKAERGWRNGEHGSGRRRLDARL